MRGVRSPIDDDGLDRLYRATPPGVKRTLIEIADAAGVKKQSIYQIEQVALRKMAAELRRRNITSEVLR